MPLVLALHGGGGEPRGMKRHTRFHRLAEKEGFLVAYPAGSARNPRRRRILNWNAGGRYWDIWPWLGEIDDVGFLCAVIDRVGRELPVDRKRVFVTGISAGAMMAYRLACEASERIAAVAAVAGAQTTDSCRPAAPVAVLAMHGAVDENVPLAGGRGRLTARGFSWPPVESGLEHWRKHNGCASEPVVRHPTPDATSQHYLPSNGPGEVELCVIDGHGHGWPGTRKLLWQRLLKVPVNRSFPATEYIWDFFARHPKP